MACILAAPASRSTPLQCSSQLKFAAAIALYCCCQHAIAVSWWRWCMLIDSSPCHALQQQPLLHTLPGQQPTNLMIQGLMCLHRCHCCGRCHCCSCWRWLPSQSWLPRDDGCLSSTCALIPTCITPLLPLLLQGLPPPPPPKLRTAAPHVYAEQARASSTASRHCCCCCCRRRHCCRCRRALAGLQPRDDAAEGTPQRVVA